MKDELHIVPDLCKGVDVSLLKAINQQVKELGWIE